MDKHFEIVIVGAGIMGSSTALALARRGKRVLLLDRYTPPHQFGSSHGETRVIREAYFEHPSYVPLIQRAYDLWNELEISANKRLLEETGGLMMGPEDGDVFRGARQSAERHKLLHEILDARAVNIRFPALKMPDRFRAVFEPRAGMLFAERCHETFLRLAADAGVEFLWGLEAREWNSNGHRVTVNVGNQMIEANELVISGGAWMRELVPSLKNKLTVERQVLHWFGPGEHAAICSPDRFPVHVWEYESGKYFYALPDARKGVKTAIHHQGEQTSADTVNRDITEQDKVTMQNLVRQFLPVLTGVPHESTTCLYTNTADGHFLIDWHPEHRNVLLLSPCSGHGFKFAPTIGEIAADLLMERNTRFDISLFRTNRF